MTPESYLDRARALLPSLRERVAYAEQLRRPPDFPYGIASPPIGVALGALQSFQDAARTRMWTRDGARVAEDPFVQFHLAEAAAEVNAAHVRLLHGFADMMQLARTSQEIPP